MFLGGGMSKLAKNSCYAAELSVAMPVSELGEQVFNLPLEQVVYFSDKGMVFLDGRQTNFYLIGSEGCNWSKGSYNF